MRVALLIALYAAGCAAPDTSLGAPPPGPKVDTIFVVDSSGRMQPFQERLSNAAPRYIRALDEAGADYQVAVISMTMDMPHERTGTVVYDFEGAWPFLLKRTGTDACADLPLGRSCLRAPLVTPKTPDGGRALGTAVLLGSCGTLREQAFEAAASAIDQGGAGACNEGIIRPGSRVVLIFVSEDDESSALEISDAAKLLLDRVGPGRLRAGAIIGGAEVDGVFRPGTCSSSAPRCGGLCEQPPPMGSHAACDWSAGPPCPSGEWCRAMSCVNSAEDLWRFCDWCAFFNAPDCCEALPGVRYVDFVNAIEAAAVAAEPGARTAQCPTADHAGCRLASACHLDWGDDLERLAHALALAP